MLMCCCGTPTGTARVDVTVVVCGNPVVGATVTLKQGSTTVATGTTNSLGKFSFTSLAAGTYTVTASGGPAGTLTTVSAPVTVIAGGTGTTSVVMTLAADYSCNVDCGCDGDFSGMAPPYHVPAIPSTLFLGDGFGTVTLTKSGGSWVGTAGRIAANVVTDCSLGIPGVNQGVTVRFTLVCGTQVNGVTAPVYHLYIEVRGCFGNTNTPSIDGIPSSFYPGITDTGGATVLRMTGTCRPLAFGYGFDERWKQDTTEIYGTSRPFVVTE